MSKNERRGRPEGTGRWGVKTRVARVPSCISDEELQSIIELRSLIGSFVLSPSPYAEGSVRDRAFCRHRDEIADLMAALGLEPRPIMGEYLGLNSAPIGEK